ncbi:MAG: endonuclease VII domain-containing protein [Frankiaceae bacterium]|nr:endonuclease VII domain-containing protein [Frankiaceae bacterium]
MKRCRDCGEDKPLEEFSPAQKMRDGRTSYCRDCLRLRHQRYRDAKNGGQPSRRSAARATSSEVKWCPGCKQELVREAFGSNRSSSDGLTAYCKPCHNAKSKETYTRLYGSTREYHLRRRYGITGDEFRALVEAQGGVCALCQERKAQHVDHDHLTGSVRGVLCSCCNQGLGNFRDRADVMRKAIDYLERTTWQKERACPGVYRLTSPRPGAARSPSSSALQHLICSRRG